MFAVYPFLLFKGGASYIFLFLSLGELRTPSVSFLFFWRGGVRRSIYISSPPTYVGEEV